MDTRLRGYDIKVAGMTNARCLSRESGKPEKSGCAKRRRVDIRFHGYDIKKAGMTNARCLSRKSWKP